MSTSSPTSPPPQSEHHDRRWLILAVIAISQLMVVLDATIVNIALPRAQADLHISDANRQWVVTAYTLAFGGLLLLGGRIADYWGRKRTFIVGMLGFAAASFLGGLAGNAELLFLARALQGAFGAMLAPASLALLTTTFTEEHERAKAFAVFGAISAGGAAIGLLLGGILTEYLSWRWCLLVNTPVAILTAIAAVRLVPESRAEGHAKYDLPGAVVATAGLVSLVYGFTKAAEKGWGASSTLLFIGAGVVLLAGFIVIETRSTHPLLPMRILLDRNRGAAYITGVLLAAGLFGATLFLTFYFQVVEKYTPVQAGLASLPMTLGVFISAGLASKILPVIGARPLMTAGAVIGAAGLGLLALISVDSSFWLHVGPTQVLLGLGLGFVFVPLSNVALVGVDPHDAGAASAALTTSQQVGGSLGTGLLNSLYISAVAGFVSSHGPVTEAIQLEAYVHGYKTAFAWGAVLILISAVVVGVMVRAGAEDLPADGAVHLG